MQRDPRTWIWDALEAAKAIQRFVAGLDEASYTQSELVHSAVERKFEVIGEALNQLSRADSGIGARVPHLAQIVAFRNQLIHGYALVDHHTVWGTTQHALPSLVLALESLLQDLDP